MAEIEIDLMSRQALFDYIATKEEMISLVAAWQADRKASHSTVNWTFTRMTLGSVFNDYALRLKFT